MVLALQGLGQLWPGRLDTYAKPCRKTQDNVWPEKTGNTNSSRAANSARVGERSTKTHNSVVSLLKKRAQHRESSGHHGNDVYGLLAVLQSSSQCVFEKGSLMHLQLQVQVLRVSCALRVIVCSKLSCRCQKRHARHITHVTVQGGSSVQHTVVSNKACKTTNHVTGQDKDNKARAYSTEFGFATMRLST